MRLASLTLERYGPFERLVLPLDPAPGRVNLVVAPNGYGKSVMREAFGDFLFGIPERSPMSFQYGTDRMRLAAEVWQDGGTRCLVRRKGRGNTLADSSGDAVAPDEARRLLGGADETLFRQLFGLDTELLRRGGQALIDSHGRLGQVLFAASGGMGRVRALLERLRERRDDLGLAGRRHKSRPLWAALSELEQAQHDLRRAALHPDGWRSLERAAEAADATLAGLRAEHATIGAALRQRRMVQAVRPWLVRHAGAQAVLDAAADAPRLDPSFEPRWRDARAAFVQASAAARARTEDAAAARRAVEAITLDQTWLGAEADIALLVRHRGDALGAMRDRPAVKDQMEEHAASAARLRHELGSDAPYPSQDCVAALSDALTALRAGGDPVGRARTARQRVHDTEAALAAALAAVPDNPLTEAGLDASAAPSAATLEATLTALADATSARTQAEREQEKCAADLAATEMALDRLTRDAVLPAPGALAAVRRERDALWTDMQSALHGDRPDPGDALAFERALRAADALADALIARSVEAARADALRAQRTDHARRLEDAAETTRLCRAGLGSARATLDAMARAAGALPGLVPGAVRAFLEARNRAVEARQARERAASEMADVATQLQALANRLAGLLGEHAVPVDALAPLLAAADRRVGAAHARDLAWARLRADEHSRDAAAQRVAGMDSAIARFADAVVQAAGRLAPELAAAPPLEALEEMERRRAAAVTASTQRQERVRQAASAAKAAGCAALAARETEATLTALRAALMAADDETAEIQLARARAATDAASQRTEALDELARLGGGRDLPAVGALVAASAAEEDGVEIDRLEARQAELAPLTEAAVTERDRAVEARERAARSSDAADAAARREAAQAALARNAEEALLLHAATALLEAALERQASAADQPLLARIGCAFRTITDGAHAGVAVEADARGQAMVALDPDGAGRKPLDQLSEGTRDQLYLALRIAALEDYAALAPPLPFVADDVLQTFDDTRTLAALTALRALSEHVQVIALTHHPHVAVLAAGLPEGTVHRIVLAEG